MDEQKKFSAQAHFDARTMEQLVKDKAHYEHLLTKVVAKMPWMEKPWQDGLQLCCEAIERQKDAIRKFSENQTQPQI